MEIIRQNRLIAAILGGLVVVSLLVLLLNDDPDSGPSVPADSRTPVPTSGASTATAPAATGETFEPANIETLDCKTLMSGEAIGDALGGAGSWSQTSRGENCVSEAGASYLQIAPGQPQDFSPGAEIFNVTGDPVSGIGDGALWFGGPQAEGDGTVGVLVVAAESELGTLIFRIAVGRPDLNSAQQLEIAKTLALGALPRFPGITVASEVTDPTDLPEVRIEHDPIDRSSDTYEDNLFARETAGDWTRAEGLIATLALFAGETTASLVTPARTITDPSATGILRLAGEYLEANPTSEDASGIERLLKVLTAPPVPPPPGAALAAASQAGTGALRPINHSTSQQADDDCYVAFPNAAEVCFRGAPVSADLFEDKYTLWFPDIEPGESWEGWVRGDSTIQEAIIAAAITLEGLTGKMPKTDVWLTPNATNSIDHDPGHCQLLLGATSQELGERDSALLQQAVASAIARCYIFENLGQGDFESVKWWENGLAWYLSDVVYPEARFEKTVLDIPQALAGEELGSSVLDRANTNMALFEYLSFGYELQGTVDRATNMALTGLDSVPNIDRDLHGFAQALTDGAIFDQDGIHRYIPPSSDFPVSDPIAIVALPKPFGMERIHLTVPAGRFACLEYPDATNLDLWVSWRPGAPGSSGDVAGWSNDLPPSIEGSATFLISTIEPDGQFELDITNLGDNPDCEDDDETATVPIPDPPCGFCNPTQYFWSWIFPS